MQRISATLQLTAFVSFAIITEIGTVNGRPVDGESDSIKPMDMEYYLSRNWGDPMMPFSIGYSQYARKQHEIQNQKSTHQPAVALPIRDSHKALHRRSRKSRNRTRSANGPATSTPPPPTTMKYFAMPLIFTSSNGWGPMG